MVDYTKIRVKAGKGGDGAVSFQHLRGRPYGPPDGGDGGAGGNIYLQVNKDLNTLLPYRYKKNYQAEDGIRGGKNHKKGKRGDDLYLLVPPGTKVTDSSDRLFADLTKVGERVMVTKGGKGGRGNAHFKRSEISDRSLRNSPDNRGQYSRTLRPLRGLQKSETSKKEALHWFERGEEGQEIELTLELKLLADVGLIGLPNAGKSTLLSKLTAATPKIASYAFTTLEPNLGVMHHKGKETVIADLPGLIEGASKGKGLGDLFLRHAERTKVLAHLISAESENPLADQLSINKELTNYSEVLADKPQIYLLTKIDIVDLEDYKNILDLFKKKRIKILPISSFTEDGLDELKDELIAKGA